MYAVWVGKSYTVSLVYGADAAIDTINAKYGDPISEFPCETGIYELRHWFTAENGYEIEYTSSTIYEVEGDITLYAYWVSSDGLVFEVSYGKISVTGYNGTSQYVAIADNYMGTPVTSVDGSIFNGMSNLIRVRLPCGITKIGDKAFNGCISLTSLDIPSGVTSIGNAAFSGCSSLTSITIPNGVTSIANNAFYACTKLAAVIFVEDSKLTSIGSETFSGCISLTSLDIPSNVTSIGYNAFYNCTKLATVTFVDGSKLTSIGNAAFSGCTSLASITIDSASVASTVTSHYSAGGLTESATTIYIKSDITTVGSYITSNYNIVTTDKVGYVKYVKK